VLRAFVLQLRSKRTGSFEVAWNETSWICPLVEDSVKASIWITIEDGEDVVALDLIGGTATGLAKAVARKIDRSVESDCIL
jgi:hypothetical protein